MEMTTSCKRCGRTWTPGHHDYVRGTWRVCVDCRDTTEGDAMEKNDHHNLNAVSWLYAGTDGQVPIVSRSRRTIVIDYFGQRLELKRRELERAGCTTVHGVTFRVSTYDLSLLQEKAS